MKIIMVAVIRFLEESQIKWHYRREKDVSPTRRSCWQKSYNQHRQDLEGLHVFQQALYK